ncbi:MAG: endolytic transglycosylase MltG [Elusimicrobia bacterium]|nr:endolytic transglycosylase MltG [Elusimicrobiota bacterium]
MKKLAAAAAALLIGLSFWLFRVGEGVSVTLPAKATARETARILHEEGVIGSPMAFRVLAAITRLDRQLKPGTFRLRKLMSSPEVLWRLTYGRAELVKVVIPEGFSARQIAERLEAAGVTKAKDFEDYVRANRLEGHIFPTTYFFSSGMEGSTVAHLMHEQFKRDVDPIFQQLGPGSRLSREQAVTLASIVEREAVLAREKPLIAAVYLNRLQRRMRLEADPTVQFAVGHWKKNLNYRDLKIDSPYNTYLHFGLPPGPICSPGAASIEAVLRPATTDALYFVADATGGHTFSVNYDDHLKAVAQLRRELRRRRSQ